MVQDRTIFIKADQQKVAYGLSNGAISMTLNDLERKTKLLFKVTPFFDTEYLTNGYRYGHSYCRKRIGNYIQAFEWHQFQ